MTLYDRIRELRIEKGMTQDDLAKAMGYKDRSMITKIEAGKVDIAQKKVKQFADVLGTTEPYLMGWEDTFKKAQAKLEEQTDSPKIRLVSSAMSRMTKEQQEQVIDMLHVMFKNDPEIFNQLEEEK